ncbi:MAG: rRNA pseudouridine synthase [Oscillospiraceae bacterium]|jgi:16S rRNA pseudouridine516 synthase|nr:rRNA pseudouridine synthase [Oscillospiraceae bacterium]
MERLDKLLASTGRWSRREAKQLIKEGRVLVDGSPARSGEDKADPDGAAILVDGAPLALRRHTYVMLHKPAGVLSATEDPRQETVLDLLPPELRRLGLFPVGRLDKDTEGLLLLTDDGELAHRLLSPKNHVDKVYRARLDRPLGPADQAAFAQGITLADGLRCMPAELELIGDGTEVLVTLHEGKFHQIKRMTASRGAAVCWLKRLSMGPLQLDPVLKKGEYRLLTHEEVAKIGGKL